MKRKAIQWISAIACAICICGAFVYASTAEPASAKVSPSGRATIEVYDGYSGKPVEGAEIVIAETMERYSTDEKGSSGMLTLPIMQSKQYENLPNPSWGECSIFVFKAGYIPYALFHAQIWENQARQGPRVYIFPEEGAQSSEPFIVVEGPQRLWVDEMIKKLKDK